MDNRRGLRTVCTIVEIVGVLYFAGKACKAECKRHKAAKKLVEAQIDLEFEKLSNWAKDQIIKKLSKENEELKANQQKKEEP
jgi:Cu/Ag efflux pump CusA